MKYIVIFISDKLDLLVKMIGCVKNSLQRSEDNLVRFKSIYRKY